MSKKVFHWAARMDKGYNKLEEILASLNHGTIFYDPVNQSIPEEAL